MAERLARIYGTEEDKVNCPFYLKMGSCRHGDRCSRIHNKPVISQTILIQNMYQPPTETFGPDGVPLPQDPREVQEHFEDFYEDLCEELIEIGGSLETVEVCQNLSDHLRGNVYAKFDKEESAGKALTALMGRFYGGRPILPQFSPVLDFREARCRQFEESECQRGGYCNFMHLKHVPSRLRRRYDLRRPDRDERDERGPPRGRYEPHPHGRHDRYPDRERGGGGYRDGPPRERERERDYGRDRGPPDYPPPDGYRPDYRSDARPPPPPHGEYDDRRDPERRPPPPADGAAGGPGGGGGGPESDTERRARIAAWKEAKRAGGGGGGAPDGPPGMSPHPPQPPAEGHNGAAGEYDPPPPGH